MKRNKIIVGVLLMTGLTFGGVASETVANAARTDMVDLSNNNIRSQPGGYIGVDEYISMRNDYGVKAVTTKITEGTSYVDPYASTIISNVQKAGMYINGYYFCRYTNVAQAKAEAEYAV